ncbi:restriction endonuclease subunit S [Flavobacterium oreochromis]|uniref:restriction endonuclease subunit S n=1 Tax=Flavobacterium oreochromis TaxID=2906078 RepID=UPI001CE6B5D2|nr:restriction endonuclease subunit S [Flavobacterium oreochromis]QYS86154.1 restriction endonuclease subunit S [Flavobacterium oreochromis]
MYESEGISLIRSLNIYDNEFKYENLAFINDNQAEKLKNVEVLKNDVLFNITGASICRCTVVPVDVLPARVNQHVSIIRPMHEKLNPKFLSNFLISENVKKKLLGIGSFGGAIMQAITKEQLQNFKVIIPPIELQNKFATIVEKVESLKKEYEASLHELENMYGVLSQKAFKGELFKENEMIFETFEKYSKRKDQICDIQTPVAGSLEPPKEVEGPPVFQNTEKDIKDMTLDEYYGIPEDIVAKYGSIENHIEDKEFILKKSFMIAPLI